MAIHQQIFACLMLIASSLAQQPVWGQCGGIGWTGPTTCVSPGICVVSNQWYSQCVPGTVHNFLLATEFLVTLRTPQGLGGEIQINTIQDTYWFHIQFTYPPISTTETPLPPPPTTSTPVPTVTDPVFTPSVTSRTAAVPTF